MAFSILTDDNFMRANTAPSTTAGSIAVTGPATFNAPSTGAAYTDVTGAGWQISGNTLNAANLSGLGAFTTAFLLRPTAEDQVDSQVAITATVPYGSGGGAATLALARANRTAAKAYTVYAYYGNSGTGAVTFAIAKLPSNTILASSSPNLGNTSGPFVITLNATGSSPTALSATIALASTPGIIIAALTASDSDTDLQAAGGMGVSANTSGGVAGAPVFSRFTSYKSTGSALALGTLSLSATDAGKVSVNLSAPLSGGSGAGYSYNIYRGTDPNFTANAGSLIATVATLPYVDTSVLAGTEYFYGIVGSDGAATMINALPPGEGSPTLPAGLTYGAIATPSQALNVVFIGDSITLSAGVTNGGTMSSPTMPYFAATKLARLLGNRNVYGANKGVSGYTTTDWAPGTSTFTGAADIAGSGSAADTLMTLHPAAQLVFSIMLGTNDASQTGTNNGGVSGPLNPAQFSTKLKAIVDQILMNWPGSKVVLHHAPWFSPNFKNTNTYLQTSLAVLFSYRAAVTALVAAYAATTPGQVIQGDGASFDYFARNYVELQPETSGSNGTGYLHPAGTVASNGYIGTQSLGEMHAQAIAQGLYGAASTLLAFRPGFH